MEENQQESVKQYFEEINNLVKIVNADKSIQDLILSSYENVTNYAAILKNQQLEVDEKYFQNIHSTDLPHKYWQLQQSSSTYKENCEELKQKLENLEAAHKNEKKLLEDKFQEENAKIKKELESVREAMASKESDFYNDLQVVQASAALQFDQMESRMRQNLKKSQKEADVYKQLYNKLQQELQASKDTKKDTQVNYYSKKLDHQAEKQILNEDSIDRPSSSSSKESFYKQYEPLQLSTAISRETTFDSGANLNNKQLFFKGSGQIKKHLPPLKPCTSPNVNPFKRKRKLHNPEDMMF